MTSDSLDPQQQLTPGTDPAVPHSARIWNYWLGGTDNYPVNREAGDQYREVYPQIVEVALASRAFQARAMPVLSRRGRYPAIPRHRRGPACRWQHPRGGPGHCPAIPGPLRGP